MSKFFTAFKIALMSTLLTTTLAIDLVVLYDFTTEMWLDLAKFVGILFTILAILSWVVFVRES